MPYTADWTAENVTREQVDALEGATLLEFGTDWCPHCQTVQGPLKSALEGLPNVRHLKIEDGKGRRLGRSFAVKIWPNFVLLRDGEVAGQFARPDSGSLRKALERLA